MTPEEIQQAIEKLDVLRKTSQLQEGVTFAFELLQKTAIQEDTESLANVYNLLGLVYSNLSDFSKALEYLEIALHINEEIGRKVGISANLHNIGSVYSHLSDYPKALEYFEKALKINEEIEKKDYLSNNLGSIANIYSNLSDYSKALEYYEKAILISIEIDDKKGISMSIGNTGVIYFDISDYTKALEYFGKALLFDEEIGYKGGIATWIGNIGNTYKELSDYPKSLEYLTNALHINEEIGDKSGIVANLMNIGYLHIFLADYSKALEYLNKAYSLSIDIGTKRLTMTLLSYLSELYEKMGDINTAFSYYKQYIEIKEEIQSEENKKKVSQFDQKRKIEEDRKARELRLARFQEQEKILHNILPANIADRIIKQETFIADHFQSVSVLFMDLVGFTALSSIAPPKQLVFLLDAIFQKADDVVEQFGLEKIKTIGDGYLAVANVTSPLEHHQKATAQAALQLLETMREFVVYFPSDLGDTNWAKNMKDLEIRIGIHTGEVVAGIIGKNKYTYDLWGDAVNIASRMESNSEAGRIHISEQFAKSIEQNLEFSLIPRGEITIKGKGTMNTYWLEKAE